MSQVVVNLNAKLKKADTSAFTSALAERLSEMVGRDVPVTVSEVETEPQMTITLSDFNAIDGIEADDLMGESFSLAWAMLHETLRGDDIKVIMVNSTLVY